MAGTKRPNEPPGVSLKVFDVAGRLVRTLVDGRRTAGAHSERWDGRDESGLNAASGVYFARMKAEGEVFTTKLVMAK